jgi:carboxyl-terminal processing protease
MEIIKKSLLTAAITCCFIWSTSGLAVSESNSGIIQQKITVFSPTKDHEKINSDIVSHLKHRHYLKISFDDQLSQKVFNRYLDELDPTHSYFFEGDIKEFETKYRFKLDNAFQDSDLKPGFEIFNLYQQRIVERLTYLIERLETGLDDMKFDIEENLIIDRKDLPWPESEAAMKELWRKRLKSDVLNLKLTDKSFEESREILLKRYSNQLNRIQQNSSDDVFEFFINSLALSIDPHSQYFSPHRTENFNINMSLSLEGIGAVLQSEDEYTKILRLIPGGPAERSKFLKAGDRIVGVAQGIEGEMLDIVGWRLDEVVNNIRGPKGTLVRLQIIPADAEDIHQTKIVHIVRDKVKLEEQAARKNVLEVKRDSKIYKIGVIDIQPGWAFYRAGPDRTGPECQWQNRHNKGS